MEIEHKELVTQFFGEWPSFHDAEVISIELRRGEAPGQSADLFASVQIRKYLPVNVGTTQFEMAKTHDGIIQFQFRGILDLSLNSFNYQNVIDDISISQEGTLVTVVFESIFGIECSFKCAHMSVVNVTGRCSVNA